jgi:hypothetical protein
VDAWKPQLPPEETAWFPYPHPTASSGYWFQRAYEYALRIPYEGVLPTVDLAHDLDQAWSNDVSGTIVIAGISGGFS